MSLVEPVRKKAIVPTSAPSHHSSQRHHSDVIIHEDEHFQYEKWPSNMIKYCRGKIDLALQRDTDVHFIFKISKPTFPTKPNQPT